MTSQVNRKSSRKSTETLKRPFRPLAHYPYQLTASVWWTCKTVVIHQSCSSSSRQPAFRISQQTWTTEIIACLGPSSYRCERTWSTRSMTTWHRVDCIRRVPSIQGATLTTSSWSSISLHSSQDSSSRWPHPSPITPDSRSFYNQNFPSDYLPESKQWVVASIWQRTSMQTS